MSQKSYDNSPSVTVIPTPIGNMGDITLRAIETLKEVDLIFCEDTRVTGLLLSKYEIKKRLVSSHKFNESKNKEMLLNALKEGKNIGIVSDRGTPGISDPGEILVKHAIDNGFNVISLPGATAFVPALTSSGINNEHFLFYGFLNNKTSKRKKQLQELKSFPFTIILYEAPHRIKDTLNDISEVLGNREIAISREISKKYEEIIRGSINDVITKIDTLKCEIVIVLEGNLQKEKIDVDIIKEVKLLMSKGLSTKESIKTVSEVYNIKKNEVYSTYIRGEK